MNSTKRAVAPRLAVGLLGLVSALFLAPVAQSQTDPELENNTQEEMICLTIGRVWAGTFAEREQIGQVPVPKSFVQQIRGDTCTRFQLVLGSLLNWHFQYGDERSAIAAVRFLEREFLVQIDPEYPPEFAAEWQIALDQAQHLFEGEKARNPGVSDWQLLRDLEPQLKELRGVKSLVKFGNQLGGVEFIAGEYARAAEVFRSENLLKQARRLHAPSFSVATFLNQQEQIGTVEKYLVGLVRPRYRSDRMEPRLREIALSVTDAAIKRDVETVQAADAVTRQVYRPDGQTYPWPDLFTFIENAYEDDETVCRASKNNSKPGYVDRCEENGYESYAMGFWYNRSRLELIARQLGIKLETFDRRFIRDGTTPRTVDLFLQRAWHDGLRYGEALVPKEAIHLLMWSGEASFSEITGECDRASKEHRQSAYDAINLISRAQSFTSPARHPLLYLETATAYVRIYEGLGKCTMDMNEPSFERGYLLSKAFLTQFPALMAIY